MYIPITDTHQHLIYADRWPYSWTSGIPQLAGRNFHYSGYLDAIEGTGISTTVFMETTPDDPYWHEETQFVDGLVGMPGSLIAGIIANCRPENNGFEEYLDSISSYSIRGLRRFLHAAPEGTAQATLFIPNLKCLADRNLPFDLCVFERQLPLAGEIASACPEVQFVLDHCGIPEIADGDFRSWASAISRLAALDNMACKISGLLAYCSEGTADTETIRPYFEHAVEAFGWDRVVWGSDWPLVTITSSLRKWVASTREIISSESVEHQEKLLHRNARRIYNLKTENMS